MEFILGLILGFLLGEYLGFKVAVYKREKLKKSDSARVEKRLKKLYYMD